MRRRWPRPIACTRSVSFPSTAPCRSVANLVRGAADGPLRRRPSEFGALRAYRIGQGGTRNPARASPSSAKRSRHREQRASERRWRRVRARGAGRVGREAGPRLWIVRASEQFCPPAPRRVVASVAFEQSLRQTTVSGIGLDVATTVGVTSSAPAAPPAAPSPHDLPTPGWWNGDCDVHNHSGSYRLGAVYEGMPARGPGPLQGGYDYLVRFFSGAWGEYEWECVELSMRFMYLASASIRTVRTAVRSSGITAARTSRRSATARRATRRSRVTS